MNEEEFDSLMQGRPFRTADATRMEDRARRHTALSIALCGRTSDDLRRQLLAAHPAIPSGYELADFRELHRMLEMFLERSGDPRFAGLGLSSSTIVVGDRSFTKMEARCEIARRAIEYLERG
jgi:hypothetical protein